MEVGEQTGVESIQVNEYNFFVSQDFALNTNYARMKADEVERQDLHES